MSKKQTPQTKVKPSFVSTAPKPEKAEKSTWFETKEMKGIKSLLFVVANIITIIALAYYFVYYQNSDMLFMAQGRSFYSPETPFWKECMEIPGGMLAIAGSYLVQFFHESPIGVSILTAMWIVTFLALKGALKIPGAWSWILLVPVVSMLISIIDTGYWVYYLKEPGYYMRESLGVMIVSLILLISRISDNKIFKIILVVLVGLSYPFIGWYSLLSILCIAVMNRKNYLLTGIGVALIIVVPMIDHYFQPTINYSRIWIAGFPVFENLLGNSIMPEVPLMVAAGSILVLSFCNFSRIKPVKEILIVAVQLVMIAIAFVATKECNFDDYNYHAECRIYRFAEENKWDHIITECADLPDDATRQIVIFKNIALFNRGDIGNQAFRYNNMGKPVRTYDSLKVSMVQTAAPLMYMHHGKTNFAYRWCLENAVEFNFNFNELKVLAMCSMLNGEMALAKRYLEQLRGAIYQREWADRYMPVVEGKKKLSEYHEFDKIRDLRDNMGSVLDGDQGLVEMYLINYFAHTMNKDSKYLQEMTLNYAMIQKDIQLFWPRFFLYASLNHDKDMPIHYQEAAYLYGNLEHNVDISRMPFDQKLVLDRYVSFNQMSQSLLQSGMDTKQVGQAMKSQFGDTFWWFYFFSRDIHSY